jgi:hypothetical protein
MSDVTVTDFKQSSWAGSRVAGQVAVDYIVCLKETLKSKIHGTSSPRPTNLFFTWFNIGSPE